MKTPKETIFLVAFFKFEKDIEFGFERIDLQHIFKTEEEARANLWFCDEAGWYEGVLIEERAFSGEDPLFHGKRVWFLQDEKGNMNEFKEPEWYKNVVHLIG